MTDDDIRLPPPTEWTPEGWAKAVRNPPATAAELRANQFWNQSRPDPRPNLTLRRSIPFWIGVGVGACLPLLGGLLYLLLEIR